MTKTTPQAQLTTDVTRMLDRSMALPSGFEALPFEMSVDGNSRSIQIPA